MRVQSLGREDPLKEGMAAHSSIPAWRIHGQRSLVGYSPWGCTESDTTKELSLHAVKVLFPLFFVETENVL